MSRKQLIKAIHNLEYENGVGSGLNLQARSAEELIITYNRLLDEKHTPIG